MACLAPSSFVNASRNDRILSSDGPIWADSRWKRAPRNPNFWTGTSSDFSQLGMKPRSRTILLFGILGNPWGTLEVLEESGPSVTLSPPKEDLVEVSEIFGPFFLSPEDLLAFTTAIWRDLCVRPSLYCLTISGNFSPKIVVDSIVWTLRDCFISESKSETAKQASLRAKRGPEASLVKISTRCDWGIATAWRYRCTGLSWPLGSLTPYRCTGLSWPLGSLTPGTLPACHL